MPLSFSKQKGKASSSSVTLHDFFGNGADVKGKARITKRRAPSPKAKAHPKRPTKSQEIIMVDSDSDSELVIAQVTESKRRKLTGNNEASHGGASSPTSTGGTFSKIMDRKQYGLLSESHGTVGQGINSQRNIAPTYSFGIPTLLLGSSEKDGFKQSVPHSFGVPAPLSGAFPAEIQFNPPSGSHINAVGSPFIRPETSPIRSKRSFDVDVDLTPEESDNWEMGDDETAYAREDDQEVFELNNSNLTEKTDSLKLCPYCGVRLCGFPEKETKDHIETCADLYDQPAPRQITPTSRPNLIYGPTPLTSCDGKTKTDVFSFMMASVKENEAWKEADVVGSRSVKAGGGRRKAPFYKVLQGMPIAVDAFCYGAIPGVNAYFLTHAHSDHYTNLSSSWKSGPIYCSEGTANLIIHMLSIDRKWVHPLPMDVPTVIPGTNGVNVTLIEANHCPGSCLFYFEGFQSANAGDSAFESPFVGSSRVFRYLHCGDFRASPRHVLHPAIRDKIFDHIYLDTTYLDPKYTFPPQPLVISACAELARRLIVGEPVTEQKPLDSWITTSKETNAGKQQPKERTLVVVGTYSVGKERVVKAIAHALKSKIYCDARKTALLRCQADADLNSLLSSDPREAMVHVVPLGTITSEGLKMYMDRYKGTYTKAIAFRPTGWTFTQASGTSQSPTLSSILSCSQQKKFTCLDLRPSKQSTATLQLFPVPYSEHSSFYELTCFAMSCNWGKMIATVNVGSEKSRGKMAKWIGQWETEKKRRGNNQVIPFRDPEYW